MSEQADPFNLNRFVEAQAGSYGAALAELHSGRKTGHWIWYVFPQLRGLGRSATSEVYGLSGIAEAVAYLRHPVLGPRLREAVTAISSQGSRSAASILGDLDAMKLRSCLTLFHAAEPGETLFSAALQQFFAGQPDSRTLQLIAAQGGA